jgi:ankyrin repeat protein
MELNLAIKRKDYKTVKSLIENGADINSIHNGYSPLKTACLVNSLRIVKLLIKNGANRKIYTCGIKDKFKKLLVKYDLAEFVTDVLKYGNYKQISKLDYVSIDDAAYSFEATKAYKGDVNVRLNSEYTPTLLHAAVRKNDVEWVEHLLKRGADQFVKNKYGFVAVNSYSNNINRKIYYLLRDSINIPDVYGKIVINRTNDKEYLFSIGSDYTDECLIFPMKRHYNYFIRTKSMQI